jgi:hypothetical protein
MYHLSAFIILPACRVSDISVASLAGLMVTSALAVLSGHNLEACSKRSDRVNPAFSGNDFLHLEPSSFIFSFSL